MTIAKDFASKFAVAFVAIAMLFTLVAPAVNAAETTEDLQTTINDLLAQVAALQSQLGDDEDADTTSASCESIPAPLTMGSTGANVTALQNRLIADGEAIAAGATGYFGAQTKAALASWQTKNNVMPAAGYYGPLTMAAMDASCTPADDEDEDMDEDDDSSSDELSGEASLDNFEVADGEDADDVEEGSEDIAVGEFTVEFTDGDAEISRIDLALEVDSGNDGEDDPWKVFDTISLWVDGDMVADIDVSDEDNYLDEDDGSLRFADLGIIAMEDEEVVITVGATVNSSIDGAADGEGWNIGAGAIRFFDADGVATTEDAGTFDLIDLTDTTLSGAIAEFTIEEAGAGDDLDLEASDADPDGTTLELSEDDNTEHEIFAFDLSAEDSDGDVTLNELTIKTAVTVATNVDDLVNDFSLEIDGQTFDAESYTGTGKGATLVFDIDGDVTIDAEETLTAVLTADFEDMESGDEGSTIAASTTASTIDAEGADDITADGGTVSSDTHTLRTTGLVLGSEPTDGQDSNDSTQTVSGVSTDANTGEMFLEFEVTAFGEDLWVEADDAALGTAANEGLRYQILKGGVATSTDFVGGAAEYTIEGATKTNGFYKLEKGETYTVTVTVEGLNPEVTGSYSFKVNSIGYNDTTETAADAYSTPAASSDYESDSVQIAS
jgi:Putative peptidoglycan binding domain